MFAALLRIFPPRLVGFGEGFGQAEISSDKPALGPDTSAALMFLSDTKVNGCTSFPRRWAVFYKVFGCPPAVSDKPTLSPDSSSVLVVSVSGGSKKSKI